MYDVTVIYPIDGQADQVQGMLYLPGEPISPSVVSASTHCALCDELLDSEPDYATGQRIITTPDGGGHSGILAVTTTDHGYGAGVWEDWCHLRCVMDSVSDGGMVLHMGAEIPSTGAHYARPVSLVKAA